MGKFFGFIKTMVLGGLLFLFPLVIVTAVVGKAFQVMRRVAEPLARVLPADSVSDVIPADSAAEVAVVDLLAMVAILVGCFAAGLVARSELGRRVYQKADANVMGLIPGYALLKERFTSAVGHEDRHRALKTVLVRLDDQSQIAFEVERVAGQQVAVFLPGAPDPWSGVVVLVDEARVTPLDLETFAAERLLKNLGRGTGAVLGGTAPRS